MNEKISGDNKNNDDDDNVPLIRPVNKERVVLKEKVFIVW